MRMIVRRVDTRTRRGVSSAIRRLLSAAQGWGGRGLVAGGRRGRTILAICWNFVVCYVGVRRVRSNEGWKARYKLCWRIVSSNA